MCFTSTSDFWSASLGHSLWTTQTDFKRRQQADSSMSLSKMAVKKFKLVLTPMGKKPFFVMKPSTNVGGLHMYTVEFRSAMLFLSSLFLFLLFFSFFFLSFMFTHGFGHHI